LSVDKILAGKLKLITVYEILLYLFRRSFLSLFFGVNDTVGEFFFFVDVRNGGVAAAKNPTGGYTSLGRLEAQ
jgi:hypothetical protein